MGGGSSSEAAGSPGPSGGALRRPSGLSSDLLKECALLADLTEQDVIRAYMRFQELDHR